jgi:hypothetical protein
LKDGWLESLRERLNKKSDLPQKIMHPTKDGLVDLALSAGNRATQVSENQKVAVAKLRAAIALHKKHMDGTAPTTGAAGEKSQQKMMEMMEDALEALTGTDGESMATGVAMPDSSNIRARLKKLNTGGGGR